MQFISTPTNAKEKVGARGLKKVKTLKTIKMERCLNCGSEDVIQFSDGLHCQRCGAKINEDGSLEYNPNEIEENVRHYDNAHNQDDENNYYRNS